MAQEMAFADFGHTVEVEVGEKNGPERVKCGSGRGMRQIGEVRRLPQEPPRTHASSREQTRKSPNRERLRLRYWWRRRESNPRPEILYRWHYMRSLSLVLTDCPPTDR